MSIKGLTDLEVLSHLKKLAPFIPGTNEDLERLGRLHPKLSIQAGPFCGTARSQREAELEERHFLRQGLTGRLRLACRDFLR